MYSVFQKWSMIELSAMNIRTKKKTDIFPHMNFSHTKPVVDKNINGVDMSQITIRGGSFFLPCNDYANQNTDNKYYWK